MLVTVSWSERLAPGDELERSLGTRLLDTMFPRPAIYISKWSYLNHVESQATMQIKFDSQ